MYNLKLTSLINATQTIIKTNIGIIMNHFQKLITLLFIFFISFQIQARSTTEGIVIASSSDVNSCHLIKTITKSSGTLKFSNWRHHAFHRASIQANKIGATHLLVKNYEPHGTFHGSVTTEAYNCTEAYALKSAAGLY